MWLANYVVPVVLGVGSFVGLKILDQQRIEAHLAILEAQVKEEQISVAELDRFKVHTQDFEKQTNDNVASILDGQRVMRQTLERIAAQYEPSPRRRMPTGR